MYPVSEAYKEAITSDTLSMRARAVLRAGGKEYLLSGEDIEQSGLKVDYRVLPGDSIVLGGVCAADLSITLTNQDGRFNRVKLNYAEIQPLVDIEVSPGEWESVPLGVFDVDTVDRMAVTFDRNFEAIPLKAADRMVRLDVPFSSVSIGFPCTAKQLLTAICQACRVPLGVTGFLHEGYTIPRAPEGDFTCRDMVSYIAELAGCWAQCDRAGRLVFRWFRNPQYVQEASLDGGDFSGGPEDAADGGDFDNWYTDTVDGGALADNEPEAVFTSDMLYDFAADDAPVTVTGISLQTETETYLAGSPRYALSTTNPLIQTDIEGVLGRLLKRVYGFTYIPFHARALDNPALEAGDMLLLSDIEGQSYRTVLTEYTYVFDGVCGITAAGTSEREHNGRTQAQRQFSRLIKIIGQKQKQLNALDEAILNASQMIAGIWGGHVVNGDTLEEEKYHGNIFICDKPDPAQAGKVWRWNLGGLGYSENGIDGPFAAAITADGSIVANLITANMVQAGTLRSLNGNTQWNLDEGEFVSRSGDVRVIMNAAKGFAVQALENGQWVDKTTVDTDGLAANRISSPDSPVYGVIGKNPEENSYGLVLCNKSGPIVSLTIPSTIPNTDTWLVSKGRLFINRSFNHPRVYFSSMTAYQITVEDRIKSQGEIRGDEIYAEQGYFGLARIEDELFEISGGLVYPYPHH